MSGGRVCVYQRGESALYRLAQCCNDYDRSGTQDPFTRFDGWKKRLQDSHVDVNELLNTSKLRNAKPYPCKMVPCLNIACIYGSAKIVEFLLSLNANLNTADDAGNTALHAACSSQTEQAEKLSLLLSIDRAYFTVVPNVEAINVALLVTVKQGHDKAVKILLDNGADPNTALKSGHTPLFVASVNGHLDLVRMLFDHGAKLNSARATVLIAVSVQGHFGVAQELIQRGANIEEKSEEKLTALMAAAMHGHGDIMRLLLDNGACIDSTLSTSGATALFIASQKGHASVVQELLKRGANTEAQTVDKATALYIACQKGHVGILRLLHDHGASINTCERTGVTPLGLASSRGDISVAQELLVRGADVNAHTELRATALYVACQKGNIDIVRLLLKYGASTECQVNDTGHTPLIIASEKGHTLVVQELLKRGANVDARTRNKATALYVACQNGHVDVLRLLHDHGASLESRHKTDATPLIVASTTGKTEIVEELVRRGVHVDARRAGKSTALYAACQHGHLDILRILQKGGASIEASRDDGTTPLINASGDCHASVVEELLNMGANVEARSYNIIMETSLLVTCRSGRLNIFHLLCEHGADIEARDKQGNTPLIIASEYGYISIVQELVDKGVDVNATAYDNATAVYNACKSDHADIVRLLYEHGASIETRHKSGATPLIVASEKGKFAAVQELLCLGADTNVKYEFDKTPLHLAAEQNYFPIVDQLLRHGADVDGEDSFGKTALHFACEFGIYPKLFILLLSHGANPNVCDTEGNTPLHVAATIGNISILNALIASNKCDLNIRNKAGSDALQVATSAGHIKAAQVLLSHIHSSQQTRTIWEPPVILEQQQMKRAENDSSDDFKLVIGRIQPISAKKDKSLIRPVIYNVSSFLRKLETSQLNMSQLDEFAAELDDRVTLEKCYEHHEVLCEAVTKLVRDICKDVPKSDARIRNVKPIATGSLFSRLKVGLPYEGDFLLEVDSSTTEDFVFYMLCDILKNTASKQIGQPQNWSLHSVGQNRVGVTLTMDYKIKDEEVIGFSVDLVPAFKQKSEIDTVTFREEAQAYLRTKGLLDESQADIITLLSPKRDYDFDTGILVSKIMRSLTEEQKRGFRVAKYLIQNGAISSLSGHGELEKRRDLELYGHNPLIRSFHLRLCLLHLLIESCDKGIPTLGGVKLALVLLDAMENIFLQFGDRQWRYFSADEYLSFVDPLIDDDSLEYKYKLKEFNSYYRYYAKSVRRVRETFLSDAASRDLSRYRLLNYHFNKEKSHVFRRAQEGVAQLIKLI